MVDVVEAEAAFDAEPVLVRGPVAALDGDDAVVLDLIGELAADAAIRADAVDLAVRRVGVNAALIDEALLHQRASRAGLHALAAGNTGRGAHGVVEVEDDLFERSPRRHADHVVDLHLAAGAHAQRAMDAGVELHRHRRMAEVCGVRRAAHDGKAAVCDGDPIRPGPEGGVRIVGDRSFGLVGREKLEDELARGSGALGRGLNLHAGRGAAHAGRGEHALALDLNHAGAAVAVRPVTGRGQVAQMRDLDAAPVRHLPDGLARTRLDVFSVQNEPDAVGHGFKTF